MFNSLCARTFLTI